MTTGRRRWLVAVAVVAAFVLAGAVPAGAAPARPVQVPAARQTGPSNPHYVWTREWKVPAVAAGAPLPANSGAGRRIVYSVSQQRVWLVDDRPTGHVARSYAVSGRRNLPRPGTYRVFSKSRHTTSGAVRMEYMVRFAQGSRLAIGFHSIPVNRSGKPIQTEAELGSFRSSGCVRQSLADAAALWDSAPVGTTVVVTP